VSVQIDLCISTICIIFVLPSDIHFPKAVIAIPFGFLFPFNIAQMGIEGRSGENVTIELPTHSFIDI